MRTIDYLMTNNYEGDVNNIEEFETWFGGFNLRSFDLYLIDKEEAKSYLKKALVMSLIEQPKKVIED